MSKLGKIIIESGSLGDFADWEIRFNYKANHACKHCFEDMERPDELQLLPNRKPELIWRCPRAAVALAEAGYAETAICVDCFIEEIDKLEKNDEN